MKIIKKIAFTMFVVTLLSFTFKTAVMAAPARPISYVEIGEEYMSGSNLMVPVTVVGSGTAMGYLNDVRVQMASSRIVGNTYYFVFNCGSKPAGQYTFKYVGRSTVSPWNTVTREKTVTAR